MRNYATLICNSDPANTTRVNGHYNSFYGVTAMVWIIDKKKSKQFNFIFTLYRLKFNRTGVSNNLNDLNFVQIDLKAKCQYSSLIPSVISRTVRRRVGPSNPIWIILTNWQLVCINNGRRLKEASPTCFSWGVGTILLLSRLTRRITFRTKYQ